MGHQITGEFTKARELDPMLAAIRAVIVDTQVSPTTGADLTDFTEDNVTVIPPEATTKQIDAAIQHAIARHKGLSLLMVAGSGKNPDQDAPGPRCAIELELQLYTLPVKRPKGSRSALELVTALMRGLHDQQIHITGFPWFEEIKFQSFDPLPDADFVAYSITFEREMSL
jgi:hypothetical protein